MTAMDGLLTTCLLGAYIVLGLAVILLIVAARYEWQDYQRRAAR